MVREAGLVSGGSGSGDVRRKKQTIGYVGIVLVVLFLVLLFLGVLSLIEFLIAGLIVGLVANYVFRRLDRQANH